MTEGFFPKLWQDKTLNAAVRALQERQYVVNSIVDYTPRTKGMQATGYVGPKVGNLEAHKIPIAIDKFRNITKSAITINFDQHYGVPFEISDIQEAQTNISILNECTIIARDALIDAYDLHIVDKMIREAGSKIRLSSATELLLADFQEARKILNAKKAPRRERFAVLSVDHEAQLYAIDEFISRDKIKDANAIKEGVIGRLMGFDILLYQDMPKVDTNGNIHNTAANNTKNVSLFYSRLAFGFGRQKEFGIITAPNPAKVTNEINIYSVFGSATQDSDYIVTIRDQ